MRDAVGGRLAHSLRPAGADRIAKGSLVDEALARALIAAGVERVTVALPDAGDLHEDAAAARVAAAFVGAGDSGLRAGAASTGRANVFATRDGLFAFEREAVLSANGVDEGVTLATLPENRTVAAGRMVATVKIIPYAVPEGVVAAASAALAPGSAAVHGLAPHRAALVQTELPTLSSTVIGNS